MEQFKARLIDSINQMTLDNIQSTKEDVNKLFEFMILSKSLFGAIPDMPLLPTTRATEGNDNPATYIPDTVQLKPLEPINPSDITHKVVGKLERKLKGGTISNNDKDIFIPEGWIRENEVQHGDLIEITLRETGVHKFYKLQDSTTAHETSRGELEYCIVEELGDGSLVADKYFVRTNQRNIDRRGN